MANVILRNLVKMFNGTMTVKGINLEIADKSFVALVGPSGCGKTTTLRMIAGLEQLSYGEIYIGDRRVDHLQARLRSVAMVFQSYALYPHMTVRQNLEFGLRMAHLPKPEIKQRIDYASDVLQLQAYLERKPGSLSGGQCQRVAMGRAIVREPEVFLFDEPLSNLDAKLRQQMRVEIKKLHRRIDNTIIYVTHDQVEAMTMADQIVVMREGVIEQIGSPIDLYQSPRNIFVAGFIGTPSMNLLPGCRLGADGLQVPGLTDPLPVLNPEIIKPTGLATREVIVGFRPEDVSPVGHGIAPRHAMLIHAPVLLTEQLGAETHVLFRLADQEILSRMQRPVVVTDGITLPFSLDLEKLHLFDPVSGENLSHVSFTSTPNEEIS